MTEPVAPLAVPLRAWRDPAHERDHGDDLARLRTTELIYRPGRILVGLGRELSLADARRVIRRAARVVVSNPDMLHAGVLPHHDRWAAFFAGLVLGLLEEARGGRHYTRRARHAKPGRSAAAQLAGRLRCTASMLSCSRIMVWLTCRR